MYNFLVARRLLANECGRRANPPRDSDEFMVAWLGAFGTKGIMIDSVVGSWALAWCHQLSSRSVLPAWQDVSAPWQPHFQR
eukprot:2494377-Pleurochrysis_carterae.AAC.1